MTRMCATCGIRPVRPARTKPRGARRPRSQYCEVCRPIMSRAARHFRQERLDESLDDLIPPESHPRPARLKQIGPDFLRWKRTSCLRPEEVDAFDLMEVYG